MAFDIDGTLYPAKKFTAKVIFYYIKHLYFFINFGSVRKELHRFAQESNPVESFYDQQAGLLSRRIKISQQEAAEKIQKIVYEGLVPYYTSLSPYPDAMDVIHEIKASGLKVAILSDYPPSQKKEIWGMASICDVILGAEDIGILKPSTVPFNVLAKQLNLEPWQILYVGNSKKYDVGGSKAAGMKSAYLLTGLRRLFGIKYRTSDFCFKTYRQLRQIVLQ